jgi:NADPH:quinone reductase-like Zn-dependent oxidoreductase
MEKVVIHSAGGYNRLKIETHPEPALKAGQVLVDIAYSGVNYADVLVRWGVYESAKRLVGWPITPGFEYSGIVKQVAPNVTRFKKGDKVFGVSFFNGYSSQIAIDEKFLFPIPASFSMAEAGGFLAVYLSAYHGLMQIVRIREGAKILVHSAAGGVGTALLQICKIKGFKAVGVVGSSHKVQVAKDFGAWEVIDKSKQDLWKEAKRLVPEGFDVVLDANGVETLQHSYDHLAPCGKLIIYGFHTMLPKSGGKLQWLKLAMDFLRTPKFSPLDLTTDNKSLAAFNVSFLFGKSELFEEAMNDGVQWIEKGLLKAPKITVFPFKDVAKAQQAIESGQTTGKLVLDHGLSQ